MLEITELIRKRLSCRTYANKPVEEKALQKFRKLAAAKHVGPFGNKPKFQLINLDESALGDWNNLVTCGVIKNARLFLVGTIKNSERAMEDYGYCKEHLILKATALGLGTCWLAGTFNASGFARAVNLAEDEVLPTVSPIGYPANQKSFMDKIFRGFAGSDHRKPWSEILFTGDFSTPLTQTVAGKYAEVLENVRLAPSASNKQPWRILQNDAANVFHFYLERAFGYTLREIPIQDIDMGIAMCHFELTARELGIPGKWEVNAKAPQSDSFEYMVSWQEKAD
jgi:nitroreductase